MPLIHLACLLAFVPLGPVGPPRSAKLSVENFASGQEVRFPVLLLKGSCPGPAVQCENLDNRGPDGRNRVVGKDGRYRALIELVPGQNMLRLSSGRDLTELSVRYKPSQSRFKVNFIYVTPEDGDTSYITQKDRDPQDYRDKIDTAAKLLQTFTAESVSDAGYGRKTFTLDLDPRGRVRVQTLRYPMSGGALRAKTGQELFDMLYPWIEARFPARENRNVVLMSFARYDPATKRASAHTAWGGGSMGLFSSITMCAWPSSIRDVERTFTDAAPVDASRLYDDSNGRSVLWALASTGMGAVLHELGHTFLGWFHSDDPESIMSRGFDHLNRAFVAWEPPSKAAPEGVSFSPSQVARWDPYNASYLACLRFFEPSDRQFLDTDPPRIEHDEAADEIVVKAPHGIRLIHLW
ncbi:MAG TPA: hypothetical protein VGE01_12020, partial [Fimbriimonas sp.]